jgi:predicted nucleic acid-binding protein
VWLALFFEDDSCHKDAVDVLDKIAEKDILVSTHNLCEIFDVIRKRVIMRYKSLSDPTEFMISYYKKFLSTLKSHNVSIIDPEIPLSSHFPLVLEIMEKIKASTRKRDNCPICGNPYQFLEIVVPKRDDIHHVVIAYELGCQLFLTFDKGFYYIQPDLFPSMEIRVLRGCP